MRLQPEKIGLKTMTHLMSFFSSFLAVVSSSVMRVVISLVPPTARNVREGTGGERRGRRGAVRRRDEG